MPSAQSKRPLAYEEGEFRWNLQRVEPTLPSGQPHPAWTSAVFVVHGIGEQAWTETAAAMRCGFEEAFGALREHQARKAESPPRADEELIDLLPPPFVYEGYWGDYADLEVNFPHDWLRFTDRERRFFQRIWRERVFSPLRTAAWYLRQLLRLVGPRALKTSPTRWAAAVPLLVLFPVALGFAFVKYRARTLAYLADVRLYLDPRGDIERAIAQRIDYRVGARFLELIGLDWEFRPLPPERYVSVAGRNVRFERVVWVAHSLGTVISYNALSALFARAAKICSRVNVGETVDAEQVHGVRRFQQALRRFVTLGSPLDKVAFLFGERALVRWPDGDRLGLVDGGELVDPSVSRREEPSPTEDAARLRSFHKEWWVNFYSFFDPVSGPLDEPLVCGSHPPWNYHTRSPAGFVPGFSHIAYWTDLRIVRFLLGRTYGRDFLGDDTYARPLAPRTLRFIANAVWAAILFGSAFALVWNARSLWSATWGAITRQVGL